MKLPYTRSLLTENPQISLGKVGHPTKVYVPNSFQTVVMVLLSPTRTRYVKVLWDGWDLYGFSSLSKKTTKSIHLQMSLHNRQQFLLSYLKTQSVGPAKVWIRDLPSADQCSPKWANQVIIKCEIIRLTYQPCVGRHIDPYVSWVLVTCWLSFGRVSVTYWLRYRPNVAMATLICNFTRELIAELYEY